MIMGEPAACSGKQHMIMENRPPIAENGSAIMGGVSPKGLTGPTNPRGTTRRLTRRAPPAPGHTRAAADRPTGSPIGGAATAG